MQLVFIVFGSFLIHTLDWIANGLGTIINDDGWKNIKGINSVQDVIYRLRFNYLNSDSESQDLGLVVGHIFENINRFNYEFTQIVCI